MDLRCHSGVGLSTPLLNLEAFEAQWNFSAWSDGVQAAVGQTPHDALLKCGPLPHARLRSFVGYGDQ